MRRLSHPTSAHWAVIALHPLTSKCTTKLHFLAVASLFSTASKFPCLVTMQCTYRYNAKRHSQACYSRDRWSMLISAGRKLFPSPQFAWVIFLEKASQKKKCLEPPLPSGWSQIGKLHLWATVNCFVCDKGVFCRVEENSHLSSQWLLNSAWKGKVWSQRDTGR